MFEGYILRGPYKSKKDGRLTCCLWNPITKHQITTTYPRYIYQKHYNISVSKEFEVHHKDGNFYNNNISNLELIEGAAHMRMHNKENQTQYEEFKEFRCYQCHKTMILNKHQQICLASRARSGKFGPFCSNSCIGKFANEPRKTRFL